MFLDTFILYMYMNVFFPVQHYMFISLLIYLDASWELAEVLDAVAMTMATHGNHVAMTTVDSFTKQL